MRITIYQCTIPITIQSDGEKSTKAWAKIVSFQPKPTDEIWEGEKVATLAFYNVYLDATNTITRRHKITWAGIHYRIIRAVPNQRWQCVLVQEMQDA